MTQHTRLSQPDKELLTRVDEVLHYLWDPIGVSDIPEARDEYTSYAGVVFNMLKQGANEEQVIKYLKNLRVNNMGMGSFEDRSNEAEVAEILMNWKDVIEDSQSSQS